MTMEAVALCAVLLILVEMILSLAGGIHLLTRFEVPLWASKPLALCGTIFDYDILASNTNVRPVASLEGPGDSAETAKEQQVEDREGKQVTEGCVDDPELQIDVEGEQLLPGPPAHSTSAQVVLLVFRVGVCSWMSGVQIMQYVVAFHPARLIVFFTVWNYILQILYFGAAAFCSWRHLQGRQFSSDCWLSYILPILFEVCTSSSILISIVLWGILAPVALKSGDERAIGLCFDFFSYNQHLVNTGFLAIEFLFNRLAVHWSHAILVIVWAVAYCLFSWANYLLYGWWPYYFLELNAKAPLSYGALLMLHVCIFFFVAQLSAYKQKVTGMGIPTETAATL